MKNVTYLLLAALMVTGGTSYALAGDAVTPATQAGPAASGTGTGDQVYGSQLMSQQERIEHRNRMRDAATQEERERIRLEHHNRMQERARQQGLALPDEPPEDRGMGRRQGRGMGPDKGSGMGPGKGGGMMNNGR